MKFIYIVLFISLFGSSLKAQDAENQQEVLGIAYNLFAVKAQKLEESKPFGQCRIPGGILLDPRKSYTSTFKKDEFFSDDAKVLKENEVFQLPGYFRMSEIYRSDIKDYFIATKIANQWTNHSFEEILDSENLNQGEEIGCVNCNYRQEYFNDEDNCVVSVFYQILPLRTKEKLEFQESITGENVGMESMELVIEEVEPELEKKTKRKNKKNKPKKQKSKKQEEQPESLKDSYHTPETKETYTKHKKSESPRTDFDKKIVPNHRTPKKVKMEKDYLGNEVSVCDTCEKLKEEAIQLVNNNYCDALKKDRLWVQHYKCQIECYEMSEGDVNSDNINKAKASLKRHQTNVKIRSAKCN